MKYAFLLIVLSLIAIWRIGGGTISPSPTSTTPSAAPTRPALPVLPTLNYEDDTLSFAIARVTKPIVLIPNFPDQQSFATIADDNGCTAAINGGFYKTDNTPLGWFVAEGKTLSPPASSPLFNAYLAIYANGTAAIRQAPSAAAYGLQAGPLLMWNYGALPLQIKEDEAARRSVIATTAKGEVLFLSVFTTGQVFDGPYLADLPDVISAINEKESLRINAAMNLDGGSASAFSFGDTRLGELTYVGSVLCAK